MAILCFAVFAIAFFVRVLQWQDHHSLGAATHMAMNQYYLNDAKPLMRGDVKEFIQGTDPLHDATPLAHPPGYGLLLALSATIFGNPVVPMQFLQIFCDAACAALLFLIAVEFLPLSVGLLAGLAAAFSPLLGFYALLLLPDSLVTLPILLAVLLLTRAAKRPGLTKVILAGLLIGISCWLRPNGLLLAPFLAVAFCALFKRGERLRPLALFVCSALIAISPITIRNYVVFGRFVPVSAGVGITLLEGIGDYDSENRFGLMHSDWDQMQHEAKVFNRPDYLKGLYNPDGIERERYRLNSALAVIKSHPLGFTKIMLRRLWFMLQLQDQTMPEFKVRPYAPLHSSIAGVMDQQPVWSAAPADVVSNGVIAEKTRVKIEPDGQAMKIVGDFFPLWTDHIVTAPVRVQPHTSYLLRVPVKIESGRVILSVMSKDLRTEFAAIVTPDPVAVRETSNQPEREVQLAFDSGTSDEVCIVLRDGAMGYQSLTARVGRFDLYGAGPEAFSWTHYPRVITRAVQQVVTAAWLPPLSLMGCLLLLLAGRGRVALILLAVPVYYLGLQSFLHVEARYLIPIHHFLMILASVPFYWLAQFSMSKLGIAERELSISGINYAGSSSAT